MADLLKQIRDGITAGFRGKFKKALLIKRKFAAGEEDDEGDPKLSGVLEYPCEGLVVEYSALYRARAGIPDTDVQVMIFAGTLPAGVIPSIDDRVKLPSPANVMTLYQIRRRETDPANATWTFQAFEAQP